MQWKVTRDFVKSFTWAQVHSVPRSRNNIWLCKPGHEKLLAEELRSFGSFRANVFNFNIIFFFLKSSIFVECSFFWLKPGGYKGWVDSTEVEGNKGQYQSIFGLQCIGHYLEIQKDNQQKMVDGVCGIMVPALEHVDGSKKWDLHALGKRHSCFLFFFFFFAVCLNIAILIYFFYPRSGICMP